MFSPSTTLFVYPSAQPTHPTHPTTGSTFALIRPPLYTKSLPVLADSSKFTMSSSTSRSASAFVPRPYPPPSLAGVPNEYILNRLHHLAPHYWNKPETADCTIGECPYSPYPSILFPARSSYHHSVIHTASKPQSAIQGKRTSISRRSFEVGHFTVLLSNRH